MPGGLGYLSIVDPDRPHFERDTIKCGHCQRTLCTKPGTASTVYLIFNRQTQQWDEVGGCYCTVCMRPICPTCHGNGRCTPWEQQLERSEARDRLRRQILGQVTG